jgi:hypothetical protein
VTKNKLDFEKPHPYNVRWGTFEEMVKKQGIERQLFPTTEATRLGVQRSRSERLPSLTTEVTRL